MDVEEGEKPLRPTITVFALYGMRNRNSGDCGCGINLSKGTVLVAVDRGSELVKKTDAGCSEYRLLPKKIKKIKIKIKIKIKKKDE